MSLYNMLFGESNSSEFLFSILNLSPSEVGRYRDIYVTEEHIVIHTRNGGGNRESYEDVFEQLSRHPLYERDEDSDFDCTYADIYFRHPPEFHEFLVEMAAGTVTPNEKWFRLFKALDAH